MHPVAFAASAAASMLLSTGGTEKTRKIVYKKPQQAQEKCGLCNQYGHNKRTCLRTPDKETLSGSGCHDK